jgi:double-strand break repair protein MRE11
LQIESTIDKPDIESALPENLNAVMVGELIMEYLGAQQLNILPEEALGDAIQLFVDKDDPQAISMYEQAQF